MAISTSSCALFAKWQNSGYTEAGEDDEQLDDKVLDDAIGALIETTDDNDAPVRSAVIASSANFGRTIAEAQDVRADVNRDGNVNGLDIAAASSSACFGR